MIAGLRNTATDDMLIDRELPIDLRAGQYFEIVGQCDTQEYHMIGYVNFIHNAVAYVTLTDHYVTKPAKTTAND